MHRAFATDCLGCTERLRPTVWGAPSVCDRLFGVVQVHICVDTELNLEQRDYTGLRPVNGVGDLARGVDKKVTKLPEIGTDATVLEEEPVMHFEALGRV